MFLRSCSTLASLLALAVIFTASPADALSKGKCKKQCKSEIGVCKATQKTEIATCKAGDKSQKKTCTKSAKSKGKTCSNGILSTCTTTEQCAGGGGGGPECAANPQGGPEEVRLTVLDNGTDLDNGWTGTSHNFPTPAGSQLHLCLSNCDKTTDSICDINGPTGSGTVNGVVFGPPLPLIAGGVPVCVINRFNGSIAGTVDLATGATTHQVNLFSDVFVTDSTRVCPQCRGGTCDSGASRGQPCTVDGSVPVVNSLATDKNFQLSKACGPVGTPVGTLNIPLPITTGMTTTPGTGASKPCRENENNGVAVQDDNCGPAGCGAPCQSGSDACKTTLPDGTCVDTKGGLSQACCNSDPRVPCFATRPPGTGITRTGSAVAPAPVWPDPTYPKTGTNHKTAATYCVAATTAFNVDSVTGLPGPGAVLFNDSIEVLDPIP